MNAVRIICTELGFSRRFSHVWAAVVTVLFVETQLCIVSSAINMIGLTDEL